MGLDITAYGRLVKQEIQPDIDDERADDYFRCRINSDFPGRADDLEDGAHYSWDDITGFAAGSYGGYGQWREQLAMLAGYPPLPHRSSWETKTRSLHAAGAWAAKEGPFWELIHFSDCDGVIGAKVAEKLAKDFAAHQEKADQAGGWFLDRYNEWRKAFELAANGGAVDFH